ncbi:ribonuclease E/G [Azospirillum brasilense]|uniref:Ribonuclease E n=2 Tax=Azospirillum brasilense TaxID=192 RepID=A0A0P0F7D2_AZOBR|nr:MULTISPECIES: ribonuclease E/G [Azospirillum]ALJ35848.1 ribonuclease E [Azospirillum brasilense]MDW7552249.1 ribonuclease E/G [Azospirillum brasilense]MDW7593798.1 ribonuclease E/G [Azospirillum brasilense]MDW7628745.1 ribonuclease E/G [Azospirillum brasilense]MDX5954621.1 ribonuclease E/G [Azospirillum brasilense]
MAKRMLVDATHPEETRVAVVNGNRLEDLDFEIATRKQLKGNIYLAKVTRVEPSLQAAFVEYGGNRHGFLAFSEIHPDYYRIPIADREALLAEERRLEEQAEARAEAAADGAVMAEPIRPDVVVEENSPMPGSYAETEGDGFEGDIPAFATDAGSDGGSDEAADSDEAPEGAAPAESPDVIGGDEVEEAHRRRARPLRSYKIQEVIKRRQVMLVQVTKEERGNKGAALTTYLSLPGRYCVLMPNTGRGGGISRKITNPADRKRLKEILSDLDIPEGMAVILRTAGLERSKQEIKRDLEYLLRLWDDIRVQTLKSSAPCLIYEEANLIKRSIRDLYTDDIDEIWVEGSAGFNTARDFMRMMMPSHTKRVMQYQDDTIPLFHRYQVETQIDAIHSPVVQLRSGGYIVINPTEALVSIDVNSGKSTRERNIEETAYKTNLEAADEVARQLRLRDLAGLIVIDFIDMEEPRNNAAVERRLKEAMKNDRARIQLGRISAFGLLELSRQRLRPSLLETNFERCPHCSGTGVIRSVESASLHVLRAIEEEGIRKRSSEITVFVPTRIALYILNQKRGELTKIEDRYRFRVMVQADDTLIAPDLRLERVKARTPEDDVPLVSAERVLAETDRILAAEAEEAEEEAPVVEAAEVAGAEVAERADAAGESEGDRRRRRRRRRGRGRDREDGRAPFGESAEVSDEATEGDEVEAEAADADDETAVDEEAIERAQIDAPEFVINDVDVGPAHIEDDEDEEADLAASEAEDGADAFETNGDGDGNGERKKRRRGKRGGRRRSRQREGLESGEGLPTDGTEGEAEAESFPTAVEAGRAVNPPELPADMEPVEFDWVLTSAVAAEAAPETAADTAAEGPAEEAAPVVEEAPARKPRRGRAKAIAAEAAEAVTAQAVTAEPEAAPAKPKRAAKGAAKDAKAAAKAAAPEETAPPPAKPSRSRKAKTAAAEAAPAPAPAPVAAPVAEEPKKRPARKRKTAADAPAEAAPAPAPVAAPVAEEPKKRPARKRKTAADAPAEAAPAPAVSEAPAAPAPSNEPASAAPEAKPRRGWWSR